jgi:hypothetical protein
MKQHGAKAQPSQPMMPMTMMLTLPFEVVAVAVAVDVVAAAVVEMLVPRDWLMNRT